MPTWRARAVTTISEFTKRQILKHVKCDAEKIHPIYCPVFDEFEPTSRPFNTECPVILQVGTRWNKNVSRVAEALRDIKCRLEIVGTLDENQSRALRDNGIDFDYHDAVSDLELVSLYQASDLIVFASEYEGFGLPIVEAQAVGRPVITSNICSMPEVAGDGACFVDPFDVQSIRSGVLKVMNEESYRNELIEKGRENVKRFAPGVIAEQYSRLYRAIGSPMVNSPETMASSKNRPL
jgi:glycosyltransferase involved in cell wall biosynthesis